MASNNHILDLIPAYALSCLDEVETRVVSEHLASCEMCRAELRAYQELAGQIAFSVPQVEPPPSVKSAVMARLQAGAGPPQVEEPMASIWQRFLGTFPRLSPAWSLASLFLILVLGASNLLLWQQVREMRSNQAPLPVIALKGSQAAPEATGLIVISDEGRHGTLVVDNLPDLGEERQYQLWLVRDGQRTSGGVFSVSTDGYGSVWVGSPEPLGSYTDFGVTIEPMGGSPGPTGERVLGTD